MTQTSAAHEETMRYCRSEYEGTRVADEDLARLCRQRTHHFCENAQESISIILGATERCLRERKSLSLIRIGNGEGNAISMTKPVVTGPMFDTFNVEFHSQNHFLLAFDEAKSFCGEIKSAIENADILGVRSFYHHNENELISRHIENGNAYAALGLTYAREYLFDSLQANRFCDKIITSAWVHLDMIPALERLLSISEKVVIVTGQGELKTSFEKRLSDRLTNFITVPVQGFVPASFNESHYAKRFSEVKQELSANLEGCLVLIGAGLFGKVYCDIAKQHGAVAIDLGSVFDVLSGLNTRPIFSHYNFEGVAWI